MFAHQAFVSVAAYFYRLILVAGLFLISSAALAAPQIVECRSIIGGANKTGLIPMVTFDPDWGIVRISTSELSCREPIEVWSQRGLPWPVKIMPGSEAPKLFRDMTKTPAPVKEVEKPAPVAIEVKPTEPAVPVVPVEPAVPVVPVEPEPIPPQHTPTKDDVVTTPPEPVVTPPEPVVTPYPSKTNKTSIISEPEVVPEMTAPEESATKSPSLADLVQSRMRLGAEETKDENITKEEPEQSDAPYLWIGLVVIGLVGGGVFLFFYGRSSGTKDEDKEENGEDDEDEEENEK